MVRRRGCGAEGARGRGGRRGGRPAPRGSASSGVGLEPAGVRETQVSGAGGAGTVLPSLPRLHTGDRAGSPGPEPTLPPAGTPTPALPEGPCGTRGGGPSFRLSPSVCVAGAGVRAGVPARERGARGSSGQGGSFRTKRTASRTWIELKSPAAPHGDPASRRARLLAGGRRVSGASRTSGALYPAGVRRGERALKILVLSKCEETAGRLFSLRG